MSDTPIIVILVIVAIAIFLAGASTTTHDISSDQPIKLSYTLRCEDGKCDTTYQASIR